MLKHPRDINSGLIERSNPRASKSLRVLHIIDRIDRGGAEALMAAVLPEMRRQGVDAQLLILKPVLDPTVFNTLEHSNVPMHFAIIEKLRRFDQIVRAVRIIRGIKPDAIHAHLQFATIVATVAQWSLRIPAASTVHVLDRFNPDAKLSVRDHIMGFVLKRSLRRVIFLSRASLEAARRARAAGPNSTVIPNGVSLETFRARNDSDLIRKAFSIGACEKLLVSVAVLRPLKGLDVLIAAMPRIIQICPETRLLIVGDGPELDALKRQASDLGVIDHVSFAGFRTDIPSILSAGDLFVLPTREDAFPTVILEAMASGLPVVASNVGGVPDMVDDSVGRLVEPDNPEALAHGLKELLLNDPMRVATGRAAREKAQREFSLRGQAKRLISLYEDLSAMRE